jgi:hypothetical protein
MSVNCALYYLNCDEVYFKILLTTQLLNKARLKQL